MFKSGVPLYWTLSNVRDVEMADTFETLSKIAIGILLKMPQPVSAVCGPITTGGLGNKEANLRLFKTTINRLTVEGVTIFNQMPFEESLWRIQKTPYYKGGCHTLESFYLPIFESGLVRRFYFIHGWESSFGAKWEHVQAKRLGMEIAYL